MATFENFRPCKPFEYDYYLPERRRLHLLDDDELYTVMLALARPMRGAGDKVAQAIKIHDIVDTRVHFRAILESGKLGKAALSFGLTSEDFIKPDELKVNGIVVKEGYVKEFVEGQDGPEPDMKIHDDVTLEHRALAIAR